MRAEASVAALLVALMVAPASAAPYLQWDGSADHSGALSDPGPSIDDVAFVASLPGRDTDIFGGPLIFGRTVYALTEKVASVPALDHAGLFAIGIDDGVVRELHDFGDIITEALASDGATIYVETDAGVTAIRASDGAVIWDVPHPRVSPEADTTGCGAPALAAGVLYVTCREYRSARAPADASIVPEATLFLSAIDARSGRTLWTVLPGRGTPSFDPSAPPSEAALTSRSADPSYLEQTISVFGSTVILSAAHAPGRVGTPNATGTSDLGLPSGLDAHIWAYTTDGAFAWERSITSDYDDFNSAGTSAADAQEWARYPAGASVLTVTGDEQDVFAAFSNDVFAYRTTTGKAEWYGKIPEGIEQGIDTWHALALSHGEVIVTTGPGGYYAFDRTTHALTTNVTGLPTSNCYCTLYVANSTLFFSRVTRNDDAGEITTHQITAATLPGKPIWASSVDVRGGFRGLRTAIGDGVLALQSGDGALRVIGRTAASMTADARVSTLYPAPFADVRVDLSRSLPGAFGAPTRYRAVWGDGDATDWQDSPILTHKYTEAKPAKARFYAGNAANQTASVEVLMHVGETQPSDSFLAAALAPDRQNITFGLIGLAATGAGGLIAILARQRRRNVLARELAALEELRGRTKGDERAWMLGVEERRAHHAALLRRRRIDSGELLVLERRIEVLSLMAGPAGATAATGATILGRYRLDRLLGEGGQGRAFLARDELIGRDVVVKTVRTQGLDGGSRRALLAEAKLAGAIDHPNVVRVLDVVDGPSEAYLILEYVDGGTLRALMRKGPLPRADALRLFRGIAAGLAAAHARGVVHGDIKPDNVLLARDGTPKLADFGTAREATTEATIGAIPTGTLRYMAPEQVRGRAADARSDVYAATAILVEMLTGRPLYGTAALDDFQLRARILEGAHDTAGIPDALAAIVARGLAADPDARYRSGADLLGGIL